MQTQQEIKSMVKDQYGKIALQSREDNASSCCGATAACCGEIMADDYSQLKGYQREADLGLGCGLPTQFARIMEGDTVADLGSGAGNDCFIARAEVGASGKIIGVDMTESMIARARLNAEKLNFHNVEFRLGEIEHLPISSESTDVVVSNCVLNLVPDKEKAFNEIYRVLKPGGHFSISDVVLLGSLPHTILNAAEMYAGCISGAVQKESYLSIIRASGFENIKVQKEKIISLPDSLLTSYLSAEELAIYKNSNAGIASITVYAEKPKAECCDKNSCCK